MFALSYLLCACNEIVWMFSEVRINDADRWLIFYSNVHVQNFTL